MIDDPKIRKLRRADLWTALGLMAFALAMLGVTSTFPITDSYGGVRNVWYVSPALFPLLVGAGIVLLALLLLRRVVQDLGPQGVREALHLPSIGLSPRTVRLLLILGSICAYVYIFVPRVDFFLATAFFLCVFIFGFHLDREACIARNLGVLLIVTAVVALAAFTIGEDGRDPVVDGLTALGIVLAAIVNRRALRQRGFPLRTWRHGLIVAILAPAFLCPAFKYGLLVPLPYEGTVIEAMDTLRYDLLR